MGLMPWIGCLRLLNKDDSDGLAKMLLVHDTIGKGVLTFPHVEMVVTRVFRSFFMCE